MLNMMTIMSLFADELMREKKRQYDHLFSCETLTNNFSVFVDVEVLSGPGVTMPYPSLLHCKQGERFMQNIHKRCYNCAVTMV